MVNKFKRFFKSKYSLPTKYFALIGVGSLVVFMVAVYLMNNGIVDNKGGWVGVRYYSKGLYLIFISLFLISGWIGMPLYEIARKKKK